MITKITRRLLRSGGCKYFLLFLPLLVFLFWTMGPNIRERDNEEMWIPTQSLATNNQEGKETEGGQEEMEEFDEEESWLVDSTQVRLWIGRGRLIGSKLYMLDLWIKRKAFVRFCLT